MGHTVTRPVQDPRAVNTSLTDYIFTTNVPVFSRASIPTRPLVMRAFTFAANVLTKPSIWTPTSDIRGRILSRWPRIKSVTRLRWVRKKERKLKIMSVWKKISYECKICRKWIHKLKERKYTKMDEIQKVYRKYCQEIKVRQCVPNCASPLYVTKHFFLDQQNIY